MLRQIKRTKNKAWPANKSDLAIHLMCDDRISRGCDDDGVFAPLLCCFNPLRTLSLLSFVVHYAGAICCINLHINQDK